MRKLLLVSLSAFVGAFIGHSLSVHAGPPPAKETRVPGDTNCDSKLDLSDAVFTLNYLFVGTAFPPCPLADPPELVARIAELEAQLAQKSAALEASSAEVLSLQADLAEKNGALAACQAALSDCTTSLSECRRRRLPATGQTKCYDQNGTEIPCDSATCQGQDGSYQTGCPAEGRVVDNKDGTVTDTCTGLMWQQDTADIGSFPWCNALAYCENSDLAGHNDWRLPNVRELQSIIAYGLFNPAVDPVFGPSLSWFWSSTSFADDPRRTWGVHFPSGLVSILDVKGDGYFVRAVRNAP